MQIIHHLSSGAEITKTMQDFGEKAGIAFQIKDDLFDYGSVAVGKPTGNDIKEKKLTLPIIYTLNKVNPGKKKELIYILKNENRQRKYIQQVINEVHSSGGIAYAEEKMFSFRNQALEILNQFPQNDIRNGLEELVRFTTDRKY